jgi:hypothetical protein
MELFLCFVFCLVFDIFGVRVESYADESSVTVNQEYSRSPGMRLKPEERERD